MPYTVQDLARAKKNLIDGIQSVTQGTRSKTNRSLADLQTIVSTIEQDLLDQAGAEPIRRVTIVMNEELG